MYHAKKANAIRKNRNNEQSKGNASILAALLFVLFDRVGFPTVYFRHRAISFARKVCNAEGSPSYRTKTPQRAGLGGSGWAGHRRGSSEALRDFRGYGAQRSGRAGIFGSGGAVPWRGGAALGSDPGLPAAHQRDAAYG